MSEKKIKLQILVCTFGPDGLKRVVNCHHPQIQGVEYLIGWQIGDERPQIPEELQRPDIHILPSPLRGSANNRNHLLRNASAPLLLNSDDDIIYTPEQIKSVIKAFDQNPDCDILTFRYSSASHTKWYPSNRCSLARPSKGYYANSFEIAFRRESVQGKIWWNPRFGVAAEFIAGEEDVLLYDAKRAGLQGAFLPITITEHPGLTTSERQHLNPEFTICKGAVFAHIHPLSWPLRLVPHIYRNHRLPEHLPTLLYIRSWLIGAWRYYTKSR